MSEKNKFYYIIKELGYHLPFSIFGVASGILLIGILNFLVVSMDGVSRFPLAAEGLFHVFHPAHILFSAVTTTAMFWKHEKNLGKAVVVGFLGSIFICGLSDMLLPFIGGLLLGADMHLHICILEDPGMILSFAVIGVISGLLVRDDMVNSVKYSHSAHVFISSSASILYLLSFGVVDWVHSIGSIFLITIFAVMIPCCLSDIAFPLACAHNECGCRNED